jgi:hypothetical protein
VDDVLFVEVVDSLNDLLKIVEFFFFSQLAQLIPKISITKLQRNVAEPIEIPKVIQPNDIG